MAILIAPRSRVWPHAAARNENAGQFPYAQPDLVVSVSLKIAVFLNVDGASFGPRSDFTANTPMSPQLADLDGDGKLDVLVSTFDGLELLKNTGGGKFGPPNVLDFNDSTGGICTPDLNGDGIPDEVVTHPAGSKVLSFSVNSAGGKLGLLQDTPMNGFTNWVAAADFDHDGRIDLAAALANGMSVVLNRCQ
jgi:hypothetical protein